MRGRLGAEEVGFVVDLGDKLEILRGHHVQASGADNSCVADERVQRPEVQDGLPHQVPEACHVRDICLYEYGLVGSSLLVEAGCGLLPGRLVEVGHHDVGSLRHQLTGDAFSESLGCAGHDDGLSFHTAFRRACGDLAAVVLHLPVVDEINPCLLHRMLSSETLRIESDLHRIGEHVGDDLRVLEVVSNGHETDTLDEQHLRRVALLGGESLDLLLRLLQNLFIRLCVNEYVGALAVHDDVRCERCGDLLAGSVKEVVHKGVLRDFKCLKSSAGAGEHLPDGRDDIRYGRGDLAPALWQSGHLGLKFPEDFRIYSLDLGGRVSAHEYSVVLKEDHLRLLSVRGLVGVDTVVDLLEKGIARIGIFNVKRLREDLPAGGLGVRRAHQAVDQGRVEVHHERESHAVVQGCLHRRPSVLCDAGHGEVVLDLLLADRRVLIVGLLSHLVQKGSVEDGESVLCYSGKGVAAGLHPKSVLILVGGVAASCDHKAGVLPEFP